MTQKHDDGGPAYPGVGISRRGMTLLDHFAGLAMQGELAAQSEEDGQWTDFRLLARHCYNIAADMIEEKRRREGTTASAVSS